MLLDGIDVKYVRRPAAWVPPASLCDARMNALRRRARQKTLDRIDRLHEPIDSSGRAQASMIVGDDAKELAVGHVRQETMTVDGASREAAALAGPAARRAEGRPASTQQHSWQARAQRRERGRPDGHKLALTTKQVIGPKSERMPTPEQEAKKREGEAAKRGGNINPRKRKENAEALGRLPTTIVPHPIEEHERRCPHCGDEVKPIGGGETSIEFEWVPGRLERRVHVVEVGRCPCKMHYARGSSAPSRVQEGCKYGPAFLAKLCGRQVRRTRKAPIYRVEKAMRRRRHPHLPQHHERSRRLLAADALVPLWRAAHDEMRVDGHVQADETSCRMQTRLGRCFVWTFLSEAAHGLRFQRVT